MKRYANTFTLQHLYRAPRNIEYIHHVVWVMWVFLIKWKLSRENERKLTVSIATKNQKQQKRLKRTKDECSVWKGAAVLMSAWEQYYTAANWLALKLLPSGVCATSYIRTYIFDFYFQLYYIYCHYRDSILL